ncbi:MAG: hypothetical protein O9972_22605 [Burkholderiales bacterium]|jgi:hypothetical protein|nr:hypothetical protein [Burkholderiales bacterium]
MDQYFGLILLGLIVVAPTVGLVLLDRFDRRIPYRATSGNMRGLARAEAA